MPKLETLELEIVQKSQTSTAGVKDLAEALSGLAKAGEATGKLSKASNALSSIASAAGGTKEASEGLRDVASALEQVGEAAKNNSGVGANIRNIGKAAKGAASKKLPTAGDDITTGEASGALDETAKKAEETRQSVGEATSAVHAFRDSLRGLGKGALNIGKSLGKRMLGNFTKDIKSAVSTMGNLFSSFKRIAMYRALRTAIKGITQGFAEGVKHLYAWADLVGNNFKQSMDSLSTSMNYMKNSLGAMVSPIIDALAPAVDILVDKFVDLINVVNQFLATITGASSWRRAVKEQKEYADETDKAAGAQKRLNHQLMAFDELNNITVNQPSSRGSGNKDDEVTDGSFVVEQLPDWAKDIREAIENGMWKTAGTLLAQKLNGLIDDWDANAFGKKLGDKFQNGIDAYLGFMKTFKWGQLGIKAADFINGMLSSVDPSDLGEAIVQKFNAAIGFLGGFASELDWDALGKWVVDVLFGAINGINWEGLGNTIGTIASGVATMIISAFNELIKHPGDIIKTVGDFFKGLFNGLWGEDGSGLVNVISTIGLIAGFKLIFKSVFGDGGLISSVKSSASGLFSSAGLTGGITITALVGLAWGIGGIADNIKKYGADEGLWRSLSVLGSPEMTAKLKMDAGSFMKSFKNTFSVVGPVLEKLGIDLPDIPDVEPPKSSANWMSADRGQRLMPEIDNTQQITALSEIEEAAVSARKKVHELPPSDDEVSKFKNNAIKMAGINGVGAVTEAAKTARAKVKQISPDASERTDFLNAMKNERDGVNLIKTAANNAGSAVDKIPPSDSKVTTFKKHLTTWNTKLTGIAESSRKAKKAIGEVPTSKKFTFTDAGNGLKNAASRAKTTVTQLNGLQSKYTFTVKSDTLGDKADEAERLYKALNNINSKSWRVQVTGDMKLKMVSERGNAMYFVEPYATGGFPTGDIFVANEAGPELVGTINGKTAVSSNQEITGIADAVYNTGEEEATLLREQNQLLRQLLAKNTSISLAPNVAAGRWVAQASNAYRKATGG